MCRNVRLRLTRTTDQARGKVGGVKWACAYTGVVAFLTRRSFSEGGGEDGSPRRRPNVSRGCCPIERKKSLPLSLLMDNN